jgi:hypothetical protein
MVLFRLIAKFVCWITWGHDFFNGGESCQDCDAPRPKGRKP